MNKLPLIIVTLKTRFGEIKTLRFLGYNVYHSWIKYDGDTILNVEVKE